MTVQGSAIPGAFMSEQQVLAARKALDAAMAIAGSAQQNIAANYGYQGEIDTNTGLLGNVRVDPTQRFGLYQQTRRNNALTSDALRTQLLTGRGLRGGLAQQALGAMRYGFQLGDLQLLSGFQKSMGAESDRVSGARDAYNDSIYQAQLNASRQAVADQAFTPASWEADAADEAGPSMPSAPSMGYMTEYLLIKKPYQVNPRVTTPAVAQASKPKTPRPVFGNPGVNPALRGPAVKKPVYGNPGVNPALRGRR